MGKGGGAPAYTPGKPPAYGYDPTASMSMETLLQMGQRILGGDIPEYYAPIGEVMPEMAEGATQRAVNKTRQWANKMGAVGSSSTLSKIGDIARQIQQSDYFRALTGRQWLGGWGESMTGKAGAMGLTREQAKAGHEMTGYGTHEGAKQFAYQSEQQAAQAEAEKKAGWMKTLAQLAGAAMMLVPGGQIPGAMMGGVGGQMTGWQQPGGLPGGQTWSPFGGSYAAPGGKK